MVRTLLPVIIANDVVPVPNATVTIFAPALLSTVNSYVVPLAADTCVAISVAVGNVIVVAAADVEVITPVATCAAVAVAVELIADAVPVAKNVGNVCCAVNF